MRRRQLLTGIGMVALAGCAALEDNSEEITALENQITTLEDDIDQKESHISDLQANLEANRSKVETLESNLATNQSRIEELESTLEAEVDQIEALESEIETLETDVTSERTTRNNRLRDLYKLGRDYFWGGAGDMDTGDTEREAENWVNASRYYLAANRFFSLSGFTLSKVKEYAQEQGDTAAADIAETAAQVAFGAAEMAEYYSNGARSMELGEETAAQDAFDQADSIRSDVEDAIGQGDLAEVSAIEAELDPIEPLEEGE